LPLGTLAQRPAVNAQTAFLRSLSLPELIELVNDESRKRLLVLWELAGPEDPPDCSCKKIRCDCATDEKEQVRAGKEWYFPEEVIYIIQLRLWPDKYGFPPPPPVTLAVEPHAKVSVLAKRRGEKQEGEPGAAFDTEDARADPRKGWGLWSKGDEKASALSDHIKRPVTTRKDDCHWNGSAIVQRPCVDLPLKEWTVERELAAWRAANKQPRKVAGAA
jgi:hypothetical protein